VVFVEERLVPLDPEEYQLGLPPHPNSTEVRVSSDSYRSFGEFAGASIPYDYRSYILNGYTILPGGTRVATRFEIDTRSSTLLEVHFGTWHVAGIWYRPFEPGALRILGVAPDETRLRIGRTLSYYRSMPWKSQDHDH
jgi:hypothetical protein